MTSSPSSCAMGAAVDPDRPRTPSRSRAASACAAPSTHIVPDRIEAGTFIVAGAVTGGKVTLDGAPCDHVGALVEILERVGVGVGCGTDTIEVDGSALHGGGYRASDIETAPYPGLATDLQSPTSVLLTQATGTSRVHEAIFEDRLEWMSELRRMGADIDDRRRSSRRHQRPISRCAGRMSTSATCAPAPRSSWPRWPPRARPPSTVRTTFTGAMRTSKASSWVSAPGSNAWQKGTTRPAHEDRYRPRHGQRPRLRQGQGHRHHGTVRRRGHRRQPHRGRRRGGPRDDRADARQHPRHPPDEGRRHRRLRHDRGDAPLLHPARRRRAASASAGRRS